ncbi:MAG: hypothetical protein R3C01_07495 [Planctomycetaceae bacterium]
MNRFHRHPVGRLIPPKDSRGFRWTFRLAVCGLLALVTPGISFADDDYAGEAKTINASDGWPLACTYYVAKSTGTNVARNDGDKNAPVVLLLHGEKGSRLFWDKTSAIPGTKLTFAKLLHDRGYAVLTIDMRKHGESQPEGVEPKFTVNDYAMMVADLASVKEFLLQEHQAERLNIRKFAIVALDIMAPIACAYAEYDWRRLPYDDHPIPAMATPRGQDVRALVLISPETSIGRYKIASSLKYLGSCTPNISFLTVSGSQDRSGNAKAELTLKSFGARPDFEDHVRHQSIDTNEKSDKLFANPSIKVENYLVDFLKKNVLDLKIEWQDRRSRLDRE